MANVTPIPSIVRRGVEEALQPFGGIAALTSQPAEASSLAALLDVPAVLRLIPVRREYLCLLTKTGALPCVRLGRRVLFRPADVDSFITSHLCTGTKRRGRPAGSRNRPKTTPETAIPATAVEGEV